MKILMLAPQPFFEPRGTPFSVLGRLKALSALGHNVDLLTYHVGQDVSIPGVVVHRTPHLRFIKSVKIGPSMTKLFLDILLLGRAFRLLQRNQYDLLHAHEESAFFGIILAKVFKVRHVYDMHSSLPQQLVNFQYSSFRPLLRLFSFLEHWTVNASHAVITICPALDEHVRKINRSTPCMMIENVANSGSLSTISEEEIQKLKMVYSLYGKKIIVYTGTFEPYQGLDLLLASAERVIRQNQEVIFFLVGGHPDQVQCYQTQLKDLGLSGYFRLIGVQPPEEIPRALQLADVLVSPRTSGTNTPSKIYPYLRSGKPIVATDICTHTQVLNADVAVLVEPNPEAFAEGILRVLADRLLAEKLGTQARTLFESQYCLQTYVQKTEQALRMALR